MSEHPAVSVARWLGLACLCVAFAVPGSGSGLAPQVTQPRGVDRALSTKSAALREKSDQGEVALPPGAGEDWWSQVQKQIRAEEYEVTWDANASLLGSKGAWQAPNRAQGFRTHFTETGIRVVPQDEKAAWQWGLTLVAWGRAGALQPFGRSAPQVSGNRTEYGRPELTEWFINEERGLEHGFTIVAPPACVAQAPPPAGEKATAEAAVPHKMTLSLDLSLTGTLRPVISEDGQAVDFFDGGNISVIHYASLKVTDSTGRVLPSRFEGWCGSVSSSLILHPSSAASGGIRISVDDTSATYPITVDPIATSPAWTGSGDRDLAFFGASVATAGDVNGDGYSDIIVGVPTIGPSSLGGRAHVFLGSPSGLSTTPVWTGTDDIAGSHYGASVSTAGDVNGDGYSDIIVGAPLYSNDYQGRAYVYLGSATGPSTTPAWTRLGEVDNAMFGTSVATAGDVNGDGYSDIIVGAPFPPPAGAFSGRAYVYLGSASGPSAMPVWTGSGDQDAARFGCSVATAGDVNGDGYSDILVGASYHPGGGNQRGRAYVFLGSASGPATAPAWTGSGDADYDNFGGSLATAGDVNGDGYSDILVGAPTHPAGGTARGRAYMFLGSASGMSSTAAWTGSGDTDMAIFGASVATAGDVNGDGYCDILIGADNHPAGGSQRGRTYSYLGSAAGPSTTPVWTGSGDANNAEFGYSVATAGDVNGDGFSDILVGAPDHPAGGSERGRAYMYLGSASGPSTAAAWTGEGDTDGAGFGYSVAPAGDVNGDGYGDILVGAPYHPAGGFHQGRAYLFLGSASGLATTPAWTGSGDEDNANFGHCVSFAGDVNGDGYGDILVGAHLHSAGGVSPGQAYVFLGSASGLSTTAAWTGSGDEDGAWFGGSVAAAGDVNGDGYGDILVGAPSHPAGGTWGGRAYLYLGSASGLSPVAAWTGSGDEDGSGFGTSVATAGDANGDGYGDILIGEPWHSTGSTYGGRAYLYLGSASGPPATAAWTGSGDEDDARFGESVATAGDVNGDGYSDILVAAPGHTAGGYHRGRAYGYLGSATGPVTTPSWTGSGDEDEAFYGWSVATAGDVNGDGYSDVIVGAPLHPAGGSGRGRAYVYLGSASGPSATAAWTGSGNVDYAEFGYCVAGAGDVNGDGTCEILVGVPNYSSGGTAPGRAYVYYGNEGAGVPVSPQQLRWDLAAPVAPLGRAADGMFRIASLGRTPFGRGDVKVEWQVAPLGGSFSPVINPIQTGATWTDCGAAGASLSRNLLLDDGDGPYIWRMRTKYRISTTPFQLHGPWLTPAANGMMETDLRNVPACVPPAGACSITSVSKSGSACTLTWQDPNPANQRTGWNVRRSSSASLAKTSWPVMAFNAPDADPGAPDYQWTDATGDISASGVWYYEVTTYNANCPAEGPF